MSKACPRPRCWCPAGFSQPPGPLPAPSCPPLQAKVRAGDTSEPPTVTEDADWEAGDVSQHPPGTHGGIQSERAAPRVGTTPEPPMAGGEADWEAGSEEPHLRASSTEELPGGGKDQPEHVAGG